MTLASLKSYRVVSMAGTRGQGRGWKEGRSARKQESGSCRALKAMVRTWLLPGVRWEHLKDCEPKRHMIQPRFRRSLWLLGEQWALQQRCPVEI